jgi:hypothetical protein
MAIKGQVLTDFLVEMNNAPEVGELPKETTWVAHMDGSSMSKRSGVGVVLVSLEG